MQKTSEKRIRIGAMLKKLVLSFPGQKMDAERIDHYIDGLMPFAIESAAHAIGIIDGDGREFFPSRGEIVKLAEQHVYQVSRYQINPADAFSITLAELQTYDIASEPHYLNPAVAEVVDAIGMMPLIMNPAAHRERFIALYEKCAESKVRELSAPQRKLLKA